MDDDRQVAPKPPSPRPSRQADPAYRITDQDRDQAAELLQRACGEGRLTLEEFSERVAAVWAAQDSTELGRATAGITPPAVGASPPSTGTVVNILGDEKRVGRWRLPRQLRIFSGIGDWTLDLRGALVNEDAVAAGFVEITHFALIGDLRVVVPEGVEVELSGMVLIGDRKLELAAVPPRPGTPRVKLRVFGLISDVTIRSAS
jgi:predicted secreted protein